MEHITNWTARRSGGRITITGIDVTGAEVRITNIDVIRIDNGVIVALDKNRESYILKTGRAPMAA